MDGDTSREVHVFEVAGMVSLTNSQTHFLRYDGVVGDNTKNVLECSIICVNHGRGLNKYSIAC